MAGLAAGACAFFFTAGACAFFTAGTSFFTTPIPAVHAATNDSMVAISA
jgi:hypothetical protein